MTLIEAIILGLIQGLTEFLPVSSSGHLELGSALLQVATTNNLLFSIIVHGATALSTIVVFRNEILEILRDLLKFKWNESTRYATKIGLSMIPVGLIGVLFEDKIEALFSGKVLFVAAMLIVTGILLLISHYTPPKKGSVTFGKAFIIGLAQAIAILPGISRSGSTITTSLFLGIERSKAAKFSFLMVLPPIIGATLLKTKDLFEVGASTSGTPVVVFVAGFLAAFISGIIACRWMVKLVQKGKLLYFAIYCFAVALIAILVTLF